MPSPVSQDVLQQCKYWLRCHKKKQGTTGLRASLRFLAQPSVNKQHLTYPKCSLLEFTYLDFYDIVCINNCRKCKTKTINALSFISWHARKMSLYVGKIHPVAGDMGVLASQPLPSPLHPVSPPAPLSLHPNTLSTLHPHSPALTLSYLSSIDRAAVFIQGFVDPFSPCLCMLHIYAHFHCKWNQVSGIRKCLLAVQSCLWTQDESVCVVSSGPDQRLDHSDLSPDTCSTITLHDCLWLIARMLTARQW